MTRVESHCVCTAEGCSCQNTAYLVWVDALSSYCRGCETKHAKTINKRWGPPHRDDEATILPE